jgi:hypothetical protein
LLATSGQSTPGQGRSRPKSRIAVVACIGGRRWGGGAGNPGGIRSGGLIEELKEFDGEGHHQGAVPLRGDVDDGLEEP